jgi:hypothetical protein
MKPKSSEDLPCPAPRKDTERETRDAIVRDADKTDGSDRDFVHGEGRIDRLPDKARRSQARRLRFIAFGVGTERSPRGSRRL